CRLRKSFPLKTQQRLVVLGGVDIQIQDGEFLSLIGPSGCGKTTLIKIIAGIESADEGTITRNGSLAKSLIPIVWQEHRLLPWRTVLRNVTFPLEVQKMNPKEAAQEAHSLLRTM